MKKYRCTICGYIYDESQEKVKFSDLPDDWTCPLCGAPKSAFEEIVEDNKKEDKKSNKKESKIDLNEENDDKDLRKLSDLELSAILSNLSKASEKQHLETESNLFMDLANYYKDKANVNEYKDFTELTKLINEDLNNFPDVMSNARDNLDRASLRSLTWSEKVTRILKSIMDRYDKDGTDLIKNTNIYVCDICGFVYIGDNPPSVCPVCKVPSLKIVKMERE